MADVLTWVMQRRLILADRAERLRKELADLDLEVARLEAAEVVFGQFADAQRAGWTDDPEMAAELERVTSAPGAGGMLLVPRREQGMDESVLPASTSSGVTPWSHELAPLPAASPKSKTDRRQPALSARVCCQLGRSSRCATSSSAWFCAAPRPRLGRAAARPR
ncbi:hypothetical protein [Streptomyces sp. NPDC058613]|uniref:hypothetical protein n=1 Tax=unclassified Streptomyces TaxID=2593676 RepID=UPI0036503FEC